MNGSRVFLVGIKGVGMTALAIVLHKMGYIVSGADVEEVFPTDMVLQKYGIPVRVGFKPEDLPENIDRVVTTGAHGGIKNPMVVAAKERGLPVQTHAQALGSLMNEFKTTVSVCGSHGKTTTSSLAAHVLSNSSMKGAHHIGAASFAKLDAGGYLGKDYFVAESDEYVSDASSDTSPRFMYQNPDYILCTNIDFDHPDVYKNLDDTQAAFQSFFEKNKSGRKGVIMYCGDDDNIAPTLVNVPSDKKYSYGFNKESDLHLSNIRIENDMTVFDASFKNDSIGTFLIELSGEHNVLNAGAVILLAKVIDLDMDQVRLSLQSFTSPKRRFELIHSIKNTYLIDDYAHHPREIEALIQATRSKYSNSRIVLLFQPHTYSRTEKLKDQFITALEEADVPILLDIFGSAREGQGSVSSQSISEESDKIQYAQDPVKTLSEQLQPGDVIITAGAGDVYQYHDEIMRAIDKL